MDKPTDSKLTFIKIARALVYLVYAYAIIATVFLMLGFVLLLFGANQSSGFVNFVYNIAGQFLKPFREIFPGQNVGSRGYFSAAGLFAIIIYGIAAAAIHSLITYITLKQTKHQQELDEMLAKKESSQRQQPVNRYNSPNRTSKNPTNRV